MANPTNQVPMTLANYDDVAVYWPLPTTARTYYPGEMMGVLPADGKAYKFDDTAAMKLLGVNIDTPRKIVDSDTPAASLLLRIKRPRIFSMALNTGTASRLTDIGKPVYATFSNEVSLSATTYSNFVGFVEDVLVDVPTSLTGTSVWIRPADAGDLLTAGGTTPPAPTLAAANGAVTAKSGQVLITKAGVAVLTIANPVTVIDDGKVLTVVAGTANAHTLSNAAGAGFNGGGAGSDIGTFGGAIGDNIVLMAYGGVWLVVSAKNVTLA